MFDGFNVRSRDIVLPLLKGERQELGGIQIATLSASTRRLLHAVALRLDELREAKGSDLAERVSALYKSHPLPASFPEAKSKATMRRAGQWKIGIVRAESFRGLAPAGQEWEYDFASQSHLLFGPNGCGKSSLLGAIAWCFTGCIFRDDCAPSNPSQIDVFSTGDTPRKVDCRIDAHTLLNDQGDPVASTDDFWVSVQLIAGDGSSGPVELWIQRHSSRGLTTSDDGENWRAIPSLSDVGLSPLDLELHLLMPARVPHLRFGENKDLVRLFSELVGLDDLSAIAEVGSRATAALRTKATRIENGELNQELVRRGEIIEEAFQLMQEEAIASMETRSAIVAWRVKSPELHEIEQIGEQIADKLEASKTALARAIGLDVPERDSAEYGAIQKKLTDLSSRVVSAVEKLSSPVTDCFPSTLLQTLPTRAEFAALRLRLERFRDKLREQVSSRLDWAVREAADPKAALMLAAAGHFDPKVLVCPVCESDIAEKPLVISRLTELRALAGLPHVTKALDDLERALISDLDAVIGPNSRKAGELTLEAQLSKDWTSLKTTYFKGALEDIATTIEPAIEALAMSIRSPVDQESLKLLDDVHQSLGGHFNMLQHEFDRAIQYVEFLRVQQQYSAIIADELNRIVFARGIDFDNSLRAVLERGEQANREVKVLEPLHRCVQSLWRSRKKCDDFTIQLNDLRSLADAAATLKGFGEPVRAEVVNQVRDVQTQMQRCYSKLYHEDTLRLDMITPGHAANPNVKTQLNVYLRAGSQLVPMAPYSNAGRIRALCLSFVFALLEQSTQTISFVLLDDPATSLDDDHKARFVDNIIGPHLSTMQVVMATHYEAFWKISTAVFDDAVCHQLPPRRNASGAVSFEPGNLLVRVAAAIREPSCSWREHAINLRLYAERTLATISGYCPEPFVIFNQFPASVTAYERISHPEIATAERARIIAAFRSPRFQRVRQKVAHDESLVEADVRDALAILEECDKTVEPVIKRLKELHQHHVRDRAIAQAQQPTLSVLEMTELLPDFNLRIVGNAAAASSGVGVHWEEDVLSRLTRYQQALIKSDVLSPIARVGQFLLLDPDGDPPNDRDLVIATTPWGKRVARRYWNCDGTITLESVNLTEPICPIMISSGICGVRRIVGVLFDGPGARLARDDDEWAPSAKPLPNVRGVRVVRSSLEPIARNGQLILIESADSKTSMTSGDLACIDGAEIGAVIKRCYPRPDRWVLCPINPDHPEDPIEIESDAILHVYRVAGVLFEVATED
jgi:hypothetical protein